MLKNTTMTSLVNTIPHKTENRVNIIAKHIFNQKESENYDKLVGKHVLRGKTKFLSSLMTKN